MVISAIARMLRDTMEILASGSAELKKAMLDDVMESKRLAYPLEVYHSVQIAQRIAALAREYASVAPKEHIAEMNRCFDYNIVGPTLNQAIQALEDRDLIVRGFNSACDIMREIGRDTFSKPGVVQQHMEAVGNTIEYMRKVIHMQVECTGKENHSLKAQVMALTALLKRSNQNC